jgi:hypothetical protein
MFKIDLIIFFPLLVINKLKFLHLTNLYNLTSLNKLGLSKLLLLIKCIAL